MKKITVIQHLLITLASFGLLQFELIRFSAILDHPYMIFLGGLLSFIAGYNLTMVILKKF